MAWKPGLYVAPAVILLAMSPAAAGAAPAPGASPGTCATWVRQASPDPGHGDNNLYGVTATSASNAWAVGEFFVGTSTDALVEHWNGASWQKISSPDKGSGDQLNAVYALSAADAWAVGSYATGTVSRTLVLRWNGSAWKQVTSPSPGTSSQLTAVRARSAGSTWAVGSFSSSGTTPSQALALHCC